MSLGLKFQTGMSLLTWLLRSSRPSLQPTQRDFWPCLYFRLEESEIKSLARDKQSRDRADRELRLMEFSVGPGSLREGVLFCTVDTGGEGGACYLMQSCQSWPLVGCSSSYWDHRPAKDAADRGILHTKIKCLLSEKVWCVGKQWSRPRNSVCVRPAVHRVAWGSILSAVGRLGRIKLRRHIWCTKTSLWLPCGERFLKATAKSKGSVISR